MLFFSAALIGHERISGVDLDNHSAGIVASEGSQLIIRAIEHLRRNFTKNLVFKFTRCIKAHLSQVVERAADDVFGFLLDEDIISSGLKDISHLDFAGDVIHQLIYSLINIHFYNLLICNFQKITSDLFVTQEQI